MTNLTKTDTGRALEGRSNFGAATGVVLKRLVRRFRRLSLANREAVRLAQVMWRRSYAQTAPHWQPLDSTAGMISQIDNMHAGVLAENDRLRGLARELLEMVEEYHACDWNEEPFTPDIDELRQRLDPPNKQITNSGD